MFLEIGGWSSVAGVGRDMCRRVERGKAGEIDPENKGSSLLLEFGLNPVDEIEPSEVFIEGLVTI